MNTLRTFNQGANVLRAYPNDANSLWPEINHFYNLIPQIRNDQLRNISPGKSWNRSVVLLHWTIIFTLQRTLLLWALTMQRMRAITLCAHNVYSANHNNQPALSFFWIRQSPEEHAVFLEITSILCIWSEKKDSTAICGVHPANTSPTLKPHWVNASY